jgi:thiol-disulfide isomerase/thioredoxin
MITGPAPRFTEGMLPSFSGATGWLNSQPLTPQALRGKVVLVDFWTYTCVNWQRTLPYVRSWAEKYKDYGLVVIGVHTPEFGFERDLDNVKKAVKALDVRYPVAIDSNYGVWNAFHNEYWPALYFIDARGDVRHHYFGEGEYEQSERVIQQLLNEAGSTNFGRELVEPTPRGAEVAADWKNLMSPETYLSASRSEAFASRGASPASGSRSYTIPGELKLNHWALAGDWTIANDAVKLNKASGRVAYRFHARDVNLVMGPAARGTAIRFRVLIDGQPPASAHGADVDEQGNGTVTDQRLYQLVRQPGRVVDRQFEIEFLDPGVEAFAFTFG